MIDDFLKRDSLLTFLVENSNLTKIQIDVLLSYSSVKQNEGSLDDMVRMRERIVTKGAFLHTLSQAQHNLRASIYSILMLGYVGLLNAESIEGLVRVIVLLNDFKKKGGNSDHQEIISLVERLCDRLVSV